MSTLDERLMLGLKNLERLVPALQERLTWRVPHLDEAETELDAGVAGLETLTNMANVKISRFEDSSWPPSLETILDRCGSLPPYSVILGMCEDGLPFVLDLANPAPGALIAVGDTGSGKTRLLKAILASAIYLNSGEQVAFNLILQDLDKYASLTQVDQCQQVVLTDEGSSERLAELIEELAMVTEARRRSGPFEPAILLGIDDLARCVQMLDDQAFARLYWLVKHGHRSRVWTVAAVSSENSEVIDPRLLDAFRTHLVGFIEDPDLRSYLSGDGDMLPCSVEGRTQFCVPYGEEWFFFWVCDPDSLADDVS